ncbi:hypothetical protein BpHYR1_046175 [Brachionus plicatilis]|uniref:Uncharacterized protein n=1 Tax=Brachionus plicatilis TaxID=10195 RepID=A0A3M7R591_BRAPC|nr:hypothetical protein BpHYR1_046175 [Brachionus plicatilis]
MKFQYILISMLSALFFVQAKPFVKNFEDNGRQKRQGIADLFGYNNNFNSQSNTATYGTNGFNSILSNQGASLNQQLNPQSQNSKTSSFGANYFGNGVNANQQNGQYGNLQNNGFQNQNNQFSGLQNNGFQNQNNQFSGLQNNGAQNQNNQFSGLQNNGAQNQNNQFGSFQNNQGYYGQNVFRPTPRLEPIIDPIIMPSTTRKNQGATTNSNDSKKSSEIPVFTIEAPRENYSKSFDPYYGMTTRKIPITPQAYWFSRYYGFTGPIAAIPFTIYDMSDNSYFIF